jgi:predicted  nucleic acid-binding Zn-ribbon protein
MERLGIESSQIPTPIRTLLPLHRDLSCNAFRARPDRTPPGDDRTQDAWAEARQKAQKKWADAREEVQDKQAKQAKQPFNELFYTPYDANAGTTADTSGRSATTDTSNPIGAQAV